MFHSLPLLLGVCQSAHLQRSHLKIILLFIIPPSNPGQKIFNFEFYLPALRKALEGISEKLYLLEET